MTRARASSPTIAPVPVGVGSRAPRVLRVEAFPLEDGGWGINQPHPHMFESHLHNKKAKNQQKILSVWVLDEIADVPGGGVHK